MILLLCIGNLARAEDLPRVELTDWQHQFRGVDLTRGEVTLPDDGMQRGVALRIDLAEPEIRAVMTPDNGGLPKETNGTLTSTFAKRHKLEVAMNVHFFAPCCDAIAGQPKDLTGLAVADGKWISPWEGRMPDILLIRRDQSASISAEQPESVDDVLVGLCGQQVLAGGKITVHDRQDRFAITRHPRSAIGLTADGRHLFLLVIDGRRPGYSVGATLVETAHWLQQMGARDGLNVDGGGSTTLVVADPDGEPILVNRVSGAAERVVGSVLGFHAARLAEESP